MFYKFLKKSAKGKGIHIPDPRLPIDYPWVVTAALISDLGQFLNVKDLETIKCIVRNRNIDGILQLAETWGLQSINSTIDTNLVEMTIRYQLSTLLKRYPFPSSKEMRRSVAREKFLAAERVCSSFNTEKWLELALPLNEDLLSVFTFARGFITRVLDSMPEFLEVVEWSRHGPGATLSTIEGFNSVYSKYEVWPYDVTKAARGHAQRIIMLDKRWLGALEDDYRNVMEIPKHKILDWKIFWSNVFNMVDGNRITFVPKDALTERTIAIEPTLNLYLQLGVDGYIRKRLKTYGVDLDSQEKNRELARIGSITGEFSTIDLKAASDSISVKICHLLLPPIWYRYLMDLRSPTGDLDSEIIHYQKISSMGNGYTFALESLIFASIIFGVQKHFRGKFEKKTFAVFGDDLIIEADLAPYLIYYLEKFGFATNSDKTFIKGPIRESCGTDWFRGLLIRPVFITEFPKSLKQLFSIRNRLRRKLEIQWGLQDTSTVKLLDRWCPDKGLGLIGPPSNEEFDTYRHMSFPYGKRRSRGQYWRFLRVVVVPKKFRGEKFFFRKLMAQLRSEQGYLTDFDRLIGLKGGGSLFDVTQRNRVIPSVVTSRAYYWPDMYLT